MRVVNSQGNQVDPVHLIGKRSRGPSGTTSKTQTATLSRTLLRSPSRAMLWLGEAQKAATSQRVSQDTFAFDRCIVQLAQRQVLIDSVPVKIGARAFDVLRVLIEHRDQVVSKNELLDLVWPGLVVEENNLQVHISSLRKLLGAHAIATVPGRGYRFTAVLKTGNKATLAQIPHVPPDLQLETTLAGNLPQEMPLLYGRDQDLTVLRELIHSHRLVTVVGVGGIGKTALARTTAQQLRDSFAGGVWIVELALVREESRVAQAIASALNIKQDADHPIEALINALRLRHTLILIDNCEHLLNGVAEIVNALLRSAPQVNILTTSQEPLKLPDEHVFRLDVLALPQEPTVAAARQCGAIALFEARASAANPGFVLTEKNIAAVIDICRQLDGLALAIELAAARVAMLGVEGLQRQLGARFRVLTSGPRLASSRHRTLLAALDWSYNLLTREEQTVFRRLGVFIGSFGLDSAQCVAADEAINAWSVFDHLGALVDKSLVVVESATSEPRYRLLETVRHYALERLEQLGELDRVRTCHLNCYLDLVESAKPQLEGSQQAKWLARLDLERGNLRAAHAWCDHTEHGGEQGLRLVNALMRFWLNRGLLEPGHRAYLKALARPGAQLRNQLRCEGLLHAGWMCEYRGLYNEAKTLLLESVAIAREGSYTAQLANALSRLGFVYLSLQNRSAARHCLEEAIVLVHQAGIAAELGGQVVTSLAELERLEGRLDAARPLYEEGLTRARAAGDRLRTMIALNNLAMTSIACGARKQARAMLIESLAISDELDSRRGRLVAMEVCAGLAVSLDQWKQAARFDGASAIHTVQMGRHRDVADEDFLMPLLQRARAAMGEGEFIAAREEGQTLTYEAAVSELRQWLQILS